VFVIACPQPLVQSSASRRLLLLLLVVLRWPLLLLVWLLVLVRGVLVAVAGTSKLWWLLLGLEALVRRCSGMLSGNLTKLGVLLRRPSSNRRGEHVSMPVARQTLMHSLWEVLLNMVRRWRWHALEPVMLHRLLLRAVHGRRGLVEALGREIALHSRMMNLLMLLLRRGSVGWHLRSVLGCWRHHRVAFFLHHELRLLRES